MTKAVRGVIAETQKRPAKVVQVWQSVVNIVLVEAKNLTPSSNGQPPDPYVKFKLGSEKYKSKVVSKTLAPKWLEQFDLHIFDENNQVLEISVCDKHSNTVIGKKPLDLSKFEREETQETWIALEENAGSVLLLLSISGTATSDTVVDLQEFTGNDIRTALATKYDWVHSFNNMKDVGYLSVKVFRAQNLAAADIGGKSDPFAVLELVNARLQTHTEYKTLNPEWNKLFTFAVKDIHSVLEVTVYDEDPNKKVEFLGKVAIPLIKIKNCEKRWYALKDRKLEHRAKGQILLELDVIWNPFKAAVRTFNPREKKFIAQDPKFKRAVFMNNFNRLKTFALGILEVAEFVESCWNWDSYTRSSLAFISFLVVVYNFELYHLPLLILIFFLRSYVYKRVAEEMEFRMRGRSFVPSVDRSGSVESDDDNDYLAEEQSLKSSLFRTKSAPASSPLRSSQSSSSLLPTVSFRVVVLRANEKATSLKEKIAAVQDTLGLVQNWLDFIASLFERVRNTLNFTTTYLSALAIIVLCAATVLLYFVPVRWIIMAWGINKFTKKLRNPHFIPNNELLDFLSRVPCDQELRWYSEFRPDPIPSGDLGEREGSARKR
uniref:C2 domain-containing protein n=1 Tax=Steinernema glaseri TaxID=37863 RepID=A0A1I8A2Y5_9BILA